MRPDRTVIAVGVVLLALGLAAVGAGFAQVEEYRERDVMDVSNAREVVPGVRNELGAALENMMANDRAKEQARASRARATPWIYGGGGLAGLGALIAFAGLFTGPKQRNGRGAA